MHKWRLINSGYQAGAMNMALDEALLRSVASGTSEPVLRFYRWDPATVTLGYAQSVASDIDLEVCKTAGLDVIRRSTGGRAVLHDREVTYAVIAPFNSGIFGNSVLDCYRVISNVLLRVLKELGLPAELVPGKQKGGVQNLAKAVCFSAPSQFELVIAGCKVIGSAQKRYENCFLQHGSIPLDMDLPLLGKVLRTEVQPETAGSLDTVGWLNRWSEHELSVNQLEVMIAKEFAAQLGVQLVGSDPSEEELFLAQKLSKEMFGNPAWTFKR